MVIGKVVEVVPVIVPAHTSVVVGAVGVAEHCAVIFVSVGVTGGVTSLMVTFELLVVVCPSASVTERVMV